MSKQQIVNKKFFEEYGFTSGNFEVLSRLSSWAVSDFSHHKKEKNIRKAADTHHTVDKVDDGIKEFINLNPDEKRKIGHTCKTLVDIGRAIYLEELGNDVELLQYVDPKTSLENRLLIAIKSVK